MTTQSTHLVLVVVVLLAGATSSREVQGSITSNQTEMKSGRTVLHVNTHRLTETDFWYDVTISNGGHDVISHRKVPSCQLL